MKKKKSNKTSAECHSELSGSGQRAKAERNLAAEKAKTITAPKVWISSKPLFPKRVPILIEVSESTTELERAEIITKRMNRNTITITTI